MTNSKKIFLILFIFFIPLMLNSEVQIIFYYNNDIYTLQPIDNVEYDIEAFYSIRESGQYLNHRLMLTSIEKSRLASLFYVGDEYEFNDVKIALIGENKYQITDKSNDVKIAFGLGEYDDIVLYTAINFGDKEFNIIDKIASSLFVKLLLTKITGTVEREKMPEESKGFSDIEIIEEYNDFLNQLNRVDRQEIFDYLKNYVDINFQITSGSKISEKWIHPAKLYFYKEGDYKSVALFYYYTLKSLGFKVRSYFVSDLIRKEKEELDEMYKLFSKRYKTNDDLDKIRKLELEYKYVNSSSNLTSFINNYETSKYGQPPAVYFYKPPMFDSSIYLITVELNNKWIYTTGRNWIDAGLYTPERACAHYARNGCYYTYIKNDMLLVNDLPITEKDIEWEIFFSVAVR